MLLLSCSSVECQKNYKFFIDKRSEKVYYINILSRAFKYVRGLKCS